jgi:MinD-like ATPase involved in chromosome partitioning or flagellar assembly
MSLRRIITVASGKGGVGKSTFAVNFALTISRVAPTVLIDLDTGTSSIRNTIDAPVERDLYHFFRRNEPLKHCLTTLPSRLDPHGNFRDFAFVASPRHAMEEFTSFSDANRTRLMRAVNELPFSYVVLDLRAGLDAYVLDFLPHSNSGVLVFTPHHPAATMAAAEIVKSLLFRKLRLVFGTDGPLAGTAGAGQQLGTINALLDRVEDSYDEGIPNLDTFVTDLFSAFGDAPIVRALAENIASFGVFFVLNMFDGVHESFERAVAPFVGSLHKFVSGNLAIRNLGWIVNSAEVHESNCERRPLVLKSADGVKQKGQSLSKVEELEAQLGITRRAKPTKVKDFLMSIDPAKALLEQLEILTAMHRDTSRLQVRDNFAYIARRALHFLDTLPIDQFGQRRLLTTPELVRTLLQSVEGAIPAGGGGAGGAPLP